MTTTIAADPDAATVVSGARLRPESRVTITITITITIAITITMVFLFASSLVSYRGIVRCPLFRGPLIIS